MDNQPMGGGQTNLPPANSSKSLEEFLELYLVKKAPFTLPQNWKEFIVKIAPWANIISIIVVLPIVLFALGIGAVLAPFAFLGGGYMYYSWLWVILAAVELILLLIALPGLFKRNTKGWRFMFYANIIMVITSLLHVSVGGLIGDVIGLYFLFQVKSLYHN